MGRRPSLTTVVLERVVEIECGLDIEEREAAEWERRRKERLARIRREARALAQTLTALYDQPLEAA